MSEEAPAVTTESAPVIEAPEVPEANIEAPAVNEAESAPVVEQEEPQAPELGNKGLDELKSQRKRRQEAERLAAEQAAQAAYWRGQAEARGAQTAPPAPKPQTSAFEPPQLDNFDTFEQYERAKDEYLIQIAQTRFAQTLSVQQQQQQQVEVRTQFQKKINDAAAADPVIMDAINDRTLPVSVPMRQVIELSDQAPGLIKWLYNNRHEAARISVMPPLLAARELGSIEANLKAVPKPTPPKRVSAARRHSRSICDASLATAGVM